MHGPEGGATRYCGNCGSALAPGARFCRTCGAEYEEPAPPQAGSGPGDGSRDRRSHTELWVAATILLIGAGAAVAILLVSGGGDKSTTVVLDGSGESSTVTVDSETTASDRRTGADGSGSGGPSGAVADEAIEAGRYVQAGSFRTTTHAEEERERLAAAGVDVEVVSSDGSADLYPGFQVLLAGPFGGAAEERRVVRALKENGVPSAFARSLAPAPEVDASAVAGRWSGELERSSGERPDLNGAVPVVVEFDPDGRSGTLEAEGDDCTQGLTLSEEGSASLTYSQDGTCVSGGPVFVRPSGGQIMVSVLPLGSDTLTTGSLTAE